MNKDHDSFPYRIGLGYDSHGFSHAGTLVLGGYAVEGCPALEGHSDADVLIHAAMDAVLGAAGQVDIGTLFPDTEEEYRGACSVDLAARVVQMIKEAGFGIVNLDAVLICDRPRIAPHRTGIRTGLAKAFAVDRDRVNVKGKSFEGRSGGMDGVECQVAALLIKSG